MNNKKCKLIGVTPRLLTEENTEKEFVNRNYIDSLLNYNCNVIMLTLNNPKLEEVLDLCDGFLITGGSDIDPIYFGEANLGLSKNVKPDLDIIDKMVIEYAVKTKKPVLGICRGHQAINIFLGGTLHQDIGTEHKKVITNHQGKAIKNDILKFDESISINSYHHQAIRDVAPNMKAIAFHEDGTIEAIIHDYLPIIGVQWHPERLFDTTESKIVFDKFFEFVNSNK